MSVPHQNTGYFPQEPVFFLLSPPVSAGNSISLWLDPVQQNPVQFPVEASSSSKRTFFFRGNLNPARVSPPPRSSLFTEGSPGKI